MKYKGYATIKKELYNNRNCINSASFNLYYKNIKNVLSIVV